MRKDQAEATSHYTLQSAVLPESELPPQNREALALLHAWMAEPDDLGEAWGDEFERDLAENRLQFGNLDSSHEVE
jgi:phytoene/squalene synthetase